LSWFCWRSAGELKRSLPGFGWNRNRALQNDYSQGILQCEVTVNE
jgi:hypothetical protein